MHDHDSSKNKLKIYNFGFAFQVPNYELTGITTAYQPAFLIRSLQ